MKKIVMVLFMCFICSVQFNLFGKTTGYNEVIDNELTVKDYSFIEFLADFFVGDIFVCVDDNPWNSEFLARYKVDFKSQGFGNSCTLINIDTSDVIELNENNFNQFRPNFIVDRCLMTSDNIPVKFVKVLTSENTSGFDFQAFTSSSEPRDDIDQAIQDIIFYAYEVKIIGNRKYVFLGSKPSLVLDLTDQLQYLYGWVLYEVDGKKQNVVLWNTNLGLRPGQNQDVYVFKKKSLQAALTYNGTGTPSSNALLVGKDGNRIFHERFVNQKGSVYRWLPMYNADSSDRKLLKLGVIEKVGDVRNDLITGGVFPSDVNIILLVDATASMKPIWNEMENILSKIVKNILDKKLKNPAGKPINPKVKVYYYNNEPHKLNSQWFDKAESIREYSAKLKGINIRGSDHFLPDISHAVKYVIDNEKGTPFFMTIIGDAGDHDYPNIPFSELDFVKKRIKSTYLDIQGVLFHSNFGADKAKYMQGLEVFKTNFINPVSTQDSLIGEFEKVNSAEVNKIAKDIADGITTQLQILIDSGIKILESVQSGDFVVSNKASAFTRAYLEEMYNKLVSIDRNAVGTYFEEGFISLQNTTANNIVNNDIMLIEEKYTKLLITLQEFKNISTKQEFKKLMRNILATYFEIDYSQVDDDFLNSVTLEDMWTVVVGDPVIAGQLIPDLFEHNASFSEIIAQFDQFRQKFINNATYIRDCLVHQAEEEQSMWIIPAKRGNIYVTDTYYWVPANNLRLFKGISFN